MTRGQTRGGCEHATVKEGKALTCSEPRKQACLDLVSWERGEHWGCRRRGGTGRSCHLDKATGTRSKASQPLEEGHSEKIQASSGIWGKGSSWEGMAAQSLLCEGFSPPGVSSHPAGAVSTAGGQPEVSEDQLPSPGLRDSGEGIAALLNDLLTSMLSLKVFQEGKTKDMLKGVWGRIMYQSAFHCSGKIPEISN